MPRKVFYSFHYKPDNWRVSTIRNIGTIEGNKPAADNDWETITSGGDNKIKQWIQNQLRGRSCTIVLIGEETADRNWINYEIIESWNNGKALLGIYIHKLKDSSGNTAPKGANPFDYIEFDDEKKLSSVIKAYNPKGQNSHSAYLDIASNIEDWIEEAIEIHNKYG